MSMDMKKKLEEAYIPDREGRKKRVVVALSGGVASKVAACLLKIQKYDLVAVTVMTGWDDLGGDPGQVLACHTGSALIENIREFCHQLGIPHFVVKGLDEFKDDVVESWKSARITGTSPHPCWNCHSLRLRLIHEKALQLGIDTIATGHFAKLFHHESTGAVYVHSSNDELHDQSALLARVPHDILKSLMLPLSDLQQKEISKLADNFGLVEPERKLQAFECFRDPSLETYLRAHVPAKLANGGDLISPTKDLIGEHPGILNYRYGEAYTDHSFIGRYSMLDRKLEIAPAAHFQRDRFFLQECMIADETPWIGPFRGTVKLGEEWIECWIHPKNFASALVLLDRPHALLEGVFLPLFKKKGRNAKVYLTGKVRFIEEVPVANEQEGAPSASVDFSRDL